MRKLTKYIYAIKYSHYVAMLLTGLLVFLVVPGMKSVSDLSAGSNLISVFVNGNLVGTVKEASQVDPIMKNARKRIARKSPGLVLVDYDVVLSGSRELVAEIDDPAVVEDAIVEVLEQEVLKMKQPVYEVKINQFTVNLSTIDEVRTLLEAAKNIYDEADEWNVEIVTDPTRELNVFTAQVKKKDDSKEGLDVIRTTDFPLAGGRLHMEEIYWAAYGRTVESELKFGVRNLDFEENVEVVQAYVDADEISSVEEAIEAVTKTTEKKKVYEVVSGDTLSTIAQKNDMSTDDLLKMNAETLSGENAVIRIGDEITVSSPEPELSVVRTERAYYEENYDAEVQYVDNDDWYTNETKVLQEPVTGFRKVVADLSYRNKELVNTDVVYEDVVVEAVAKIVERGTKEPPTYIYPVYGRISSPFGRRKAPKKGASTFHKGIDFAVPIGTAVQATSGGTVARAGWGSGYGYCVYIQHPNGTMSRYGHLSKILVKTGQSVKQGQKIALSGNTGVSTGPHMHFEILVGGAQVNPLNYIH